MNCPRKLGERKNPTTISDDWIIRDFMITVNLYYKGINGNARAFVDEMESSGIADAIRAEEGNLRYEYFQPLKDPETVLLIDSWTDQKAIDLHHASPMMKQPLWKPSCRRAMRSSSLWSKRQQSETGRSSEDSSVTTKPEILPLHFIMKEI